MRLSAPLSARTLKKCVNLAAIVGQFTRLRRSGPQLLGLCPLHSEGNPSFYVHPQKQVFKCFGCGFGGDVFDFVMLVRDLPFSGAVEWVNDFLLRESSSSGVAGASGPRSGPLVGPSEGAAPQAAKRPASYSPPSENSRAQILALLEATERRLAEIAATNRAASEALATACEPERSSLFT